MANDDNVSFRVELLMSPRRYIAHRNQLGGVDSRCLKFPGLAYIEQRERFPRIQLGLYFFGSDFVFHLGVNSLLPYPLRLALLHESTDALMGICGLRQFLKINPLRADKTLVEVH
jgi:hypothetical protein